MAARAWRGSAQRVGRTVRADERAQGAQHGLEARARRQAARSPPSSTSGGGTPPSDGWPLSKSLFLYLSPRTGRLGLGKCEKGPTRNPSLVQ